MTLGSNNRQDGATESTKMKLAIMFLNTNGTSGIAGPDLDNDSSAYCGCSKSSVSLSKEVKWISLMLCQDATLKKKIEEKITSCVVVEELELSIISKC